MDNFNDVVNEENGNELINIDTNVDSVVDEVVEKFYFDEASNGQRKDIEFCLAQLELWELVGVPFDRQEPEYRKWKKNASKVNDAAEKVAKAERDENEAIGELVTRLIADKLTYVEKADKFMVWDNIKFCWIELSERAVRMRYSVTSQKSYERLCYILDSYEMKKTTASYSYNADDAGSTELNLMNRDHWLSGEGGDADDVPVIFNMLMDSICGGDAEQQSHLERCLLYKLRNPEDVTIPMILINGSGNTGKSLFATYILGAIVGSSFVARLSKEMAIGEKNGELVGRVFTVLEETKRAMGDDDKYKNLLGTETLSIDAKYGMQDSGVPNTAMYFNFNNQPDGGYTLAGDDMGVDRRVSVLGAFGSLYGSIRTGLAGDDALSDDGVREYFNKNKKWLRDRRTVNNWLASLVEKHGIVKTVPVPFHKDHYWNLVSMQRGGYYDVFDNIFNDPDFDFIVKDDLYEMCVIANNKSSNSQQNRLKKSKLIIAEAMKYCADHGIEMVEGKLNWKGEDGKLSSRMCLHRSGVGTVVNNRAKYLNDHFGGVKIVFYGAVDDCVDADTGVDGIFED